MKFSHTLEVGSVLRWVRNKFRPRALILMYHRIVDLPSDPNLICVTPKHFAEQLEFLRQHYHVIPLKDLVQALRDGNVPNGAVVMTFDDGYADNLHNAKPLLERYDVPAAVFVTSGYTGSRMEFWWDELERLLLQPGTLPQMLQLEVNGRIMGWQIEEACYYSEEESKLHRSWNIEQPDDPSSRHRLFREIYRVLHSLPPKVQRTTLDQLRQWAGVENVGRPTHRALTGDELVELADGGLVEIGAHTANHPVLASIPFAMQRDEIRESKESLEKILGYPIASFTYPHGSKTTETVSALHEFGFKSACSSVDEVVWQNADTFSLPRIVVGDWDGDKFGRWMAKLI